jgi:hypothetical protein
MDLNIESPVFVAIIPIYRKKKLPFACKSKGEQAILKISLNAEQ